MVDVSSHRGGLEYGRCGSVTVGVQSMGWDGSLHEEGGLVFAIHGYATLSGNDRDRFRTAAQLVSSSWLEHGEACLARLDGEFSLLVVDPAAGQIIATCSVGGTRPLFFGSTPETLVVATEVRQVRTGLGLKPELDELNLIRMILNKPLPEGGTLDRKVWRVYPSQVHRFSTAEPGQAPARTAYWSPPRPATGGARWRFEESVARLREVLQEVVGSAVPQTPWALSLSGGRDSGALFSLASSVARSRGEEDMGRPVSLEFPGMKCDERRYIEDSVRHASALDPLWIDAAAIDPLDRSLEFVADLDTFPFLTTYFAGLVAAAAQANRRRVLITGNGGDEWLGGSTRPYLQQDIGSGRLLLGLRNLLRYELPAEARRGRFAWEWGLRPAAGSILRYLGWRRAPDRPSWVSEDCWEEIAEPVEIPWLKVERGPVREFLASCLHHRRTAADLWAMEQVVALRRCELRLPWMHRRLIDFAFQVPPEHVIGGVREKHLLRVALRGAFPPSVESRRHRTSFAEVFDSRKDLLCERLQSHDWVLGQVEGFDQAGLESQIARCDQSLSLRPTVGLYLVDRYLAATRS